MIKINEKEEACLEVLHSIFEHDGNCTYFRRIAKDTGLDEKAVRRAVRSLARKGLAEYMRGLFDEDGMVAGSGYCATRAGFDFIESKQAVTPLPI